jgi:hypothetical protein
MTCSILSRWGKSTTGDRLEQLNEALAKGDYALVSNDTQGFAGDLVIDFPLNLPDPYRALILVKKSGPAGESRPEPAPLILGKNQPPGE